MSGVGITYLWPNKKFPPFIRLEGKRGDYEVYTPELTCNLVEDGDSLHCSNCGGGAEKQSWAYWRYCPNCGAKVLRNTPKYSETGARVIKSDKDLAQEVDE